VSQVGIVNVGDAKTAQRAAGREFLTAFRQLNMSFCGTDKPFPLRRVLLSLHRQKYSHVLNFIPVDLADPNVLLGRKSCDSFTLHIFHANCELEALT
jgi:hypothetical protein